MAYLIKKTVVALIFFPVIALSALPVAFCAEAVPNGDSPAMVKEADLQECLQTAMENNRRRPASRYAVAMAEARHRQALAGYWPQISAGGGYLQMDEAPNFLFPASSMSLPMGGSIPVTIPGVGTVPLSAIDIPAQNVKLMDDESYSASLDATWLLFDGGMRRGYQEQAKGLVEMMKQDCRRTDLEITDSVKRLYYGAVLAARLHRLGNDTLARMETTLDLTAAMYQEGSGKVKKTDWLDNKVMVESLRGMVAQLEKNDLMARAALANTMGLPWNTSVKPIDSEIPFSPSPQNLDRLVATAYRFNPDWAKLEAAIQAAQGALRTARSGFFPKLALTGKLHRWWNDYDGGLSTEGNREGWNVGVGVEIPIFEGFLTQGKVAETRARLAKIREEQLLLKEGIGLEIRDLFLALGAAEKTRQASLDAMEAAVDNRDLNTRAYQHGLVETEKVIRAQLVEALMSAQHHKACYDWIAIQSQLDLAVGTEILEMMMPL
jgi:outer membrane protein TolC